MKTKLLLSAIIATSFTTNVNAEAEEGWKGQGEAGFVTTSGNTDSIALT